MSSWPLIAGFFCAGFFLFAVQPFKLGDRVAVSYSTPSAGNRTAWFEGTCEKVDLRWVEWSLRKRHLVEDNLLLHVHSIYILIAYHDTRQCTCRYTIVKNGPRRLFVPNSAFLTREFMVSLLTTSYASSCMPGSSLIPWNLLHCLTMTPCRWWMIPPIRLSVIWGRTRTLA